MPTGSTTRCGPSPAGCCTRGASRSSWGIGTGTPVTRSPIRFRGMPAAVQGHDALRALFGGFGAAAASIEVQDVTFHQTEDPNVAIIEEQMTAVLHDGSHYELSLIHISEPTRRTPISYA